MGYFFVMIRGLPFAICLRCTLEGRGNGPGGRIVMNEATILLVAIDLGGGGTWRGGVGVVL